MYPPRFRSVKIHLNKGEPPPGDEPCLSFEITPDGSSIHYKNTEVANNADSEKLTDFETNHNLLSRLFNIGTQQKALEELTSLLGNMVKSSGMSTEEKQAARYFTESLKSMKPKAIQKLYIPPVHSKASPRTDSNRICIFSTTPLEDPVLRAKLGKDVIDRTRDKIQLIEIFATDKTKRRNEAAAGLVKQAKNFIGGGVNGFLGKVPRQF
jgi:hypothetical protein